MFPLVIYFTVIELQLFMPSKGVQNSPGFLWKPLFRIFLLPLDNEVL